MDYLKLKKFFGRLNGIKMLIDAEKTITDNIGIDYNSLVDQLCDLINEDPTDFKLPDTVFHIEAFGNRKFIHSFDFKGKVYQILSYLEYGFNLNESIVEIGSIYNSIQDQELKSRCADLLSAPGNFDRAINQATQVLEDRIRNISKSGQGMIGVDLINKLIKSDPNESEIKLSDDKYEQEGMAHIMRGIMLAFRNQTHHYLTDKFTREDSLKLVVFIDTILNSLNNAIINK